MYRQHPSEEVVAIIAVAAVLFHLKSGFLNRKGDYRKAMMTGIVYTG